MATMVERHEEIFSQRVKGNPDAKIQAMLKELCERVDAIEDDVEIVLDKADQELEAFNRDIAERAGAKLANELKNPEELPF